MGNRLPPFASGKHLHVSKDFPDVGRNPQVREAGEVGREAL